jgi:hypothetical protein
MEKSISVVAWLTCGIDYPSFWLRLSQSHIPETSRLEFQTSPRASSRLVWRRKSHEYRMPYSASA